MSADPLVHHYEKTLRLIENMAVTSAMKSIPKLPFGVKLGEPQPWDDQQLGAVAAMLAEGARMAAAELRAGRGAA